MSDPTVARYKQWLLERMYLVMPHLRQSPVTAKRDLAKTMHNENQVDIFAYEQAEQLNLSEGAISDSLGKLNFDYNII